MSVYPPRRRLSAQVTLGLPSAVVVVLSLVAGGLQVVNEVVLAGHAQIQGIIAVALVFLVGIGIAPVRGAAWRALLHLPDWANTLVAAIITAATGVLQVVGVSYTLHVVLITVLTVLAALGFGSNPGTLPQGKPVAVSPPRT